MVPTRRIRTLVDRPPNSGGHFVLYWMTASRRLEWNFALDRAVELAKTHGVPLFVLEALRVDYPWAGARHHRFALDGMAEHRSRLRGTPIMYYPYVEPAPGAGKGLVRALAAESSAVVTDWYPTFFLPRMLTAASEQLSTRLEAVDSCGLLPLAATEKPFSAAYHFRRHLQKTLPEYLLDLPAPVLPEDLPSGGAVPADVAERWPAAHADLLAGVPGSLERLPIDHTVGPVALRGGRSAAARLLDAFLEEGLSRYAEDRNHPDADIGSRLSAHLHWGHISAHEVFRRVAAHESWSPARLSQRADGRRAGWWGMSEAAEAFLDQLVTWRELGYSFCEHVPEHTSYDSLSEWAKDTLEVHAADERPHVYSLDAFEAAATHDEIWNAAQRQLVREGTIHNYLRMLWGKKILEWSRTPQEALDVMVHLNDKYALDGRDPNSYSGIFWVMGRFDRGWPERPIYGKVRSMSSERTRKKVDLEEYLVRYGE